MRLLLSLWALLGVLAIGEARLDPEVLAAELDAVVREHLETSGVPGVLVVVTEGEQVVVLEGWGLADVEGEVPMDPEQTLVRIASLSKTFTATAVVQLEDAGQLDLDADIDTYLSRLRTGGDPKADPDDAFSPVTLRHLLAHTSGFINYNSGRVSLAPPRPEDFEAFIARTMPPRMHPPGAATLYTNHGNALAGLVVQEVSGEPFVDHVRRQILAPLGMDSTVYYLDPADGADPFAHRLARSYRAEGGELVAQRYEHFQTTPASAVHSTAADMARYLMLHAGSGSVGGEVVVSAAAMERMRTPHPTIHPALPEYHYAFAPTSIAGRDARTHGGSVPAYLSRMAIFDEYGVGVFVAQNAFGDNVSAAVMEVVAGHLPSEGEGESESKGREDFHGAQEAVAGVYRVLDKRETAAFTRPFAVLAPAPEEAQIEVEVEDLAGGEPVVRVDGERVEGPDADGAYRRVRADGKRSAVVFMTDEKGRRWVHVDRRSASAIPWHGRRGLHIGLYGGALALVFLGAVFAFGSGAWLGCRGPRFEPDAKSASAGWRWTWPCVWAGLGLAVLLGTMAPTAYAFVADAGQPLYTQPLRLGTPGWIVALTVLPRLAALAALFALARSPVRAAPVALALGAWILVFLDLYWQTPGPGLPAALILGA